MRERFTFVGPGRTPEEEVSAAYSMARKRKEKEKFSEIELEKTAEELRVIDYIDDLLKEEFCDLGIIEMPEIHPDRFVFISEEDFSQRESKEGVKGTYFSFEDVAMFCRERSLNRVDLYKTMMHEAVHMTSHMKHWVDVKNKKINQYRVGYSIANTSHPDDRHPHLNAFNEGVTELTVEQFFHKHKNDIVKKFDFSDEEFREAKFSYALFRSIVMVICEGVAAYEGVKKIDVWERIKKGQFTGELMHLRGIERAYGFEALDVLDALEIDDSDIANSTKEVASQKNEKILEYFLNYDQPGNDRSIIRKKLMDEILGEKVEDK